MVELANREAAVTDVLDGVLAFKPVPREKPADEGVVVEAIFGACCPKFKTSPLVV